MTHTAVICAIPLEDSTRQLVLLYFGQGDQLRSKAASRAAAMLTQAVEWSVSPMRNIKLSVAGVCVHLALGTCVAPLLAQRASEGAVGSLVIEWPQDSALLTTARAVVLATDTLRSLWPGFWTEEQSFTLFEPGRGALLVGRRQPDAPFTRVWPIPGMLALDGLLYGTRENIPGLRRSSGPSDYGFNTRFRSGTVIAPSIQIGDSLAHTLNVLFHEVFHAYQSQSFKVMPRQQDLTSETFLDAQYTALAEIERRLLADALGLTGAGRARKLEEYSAIRARREASLARSFVEAERRQETFEGTAHYVGLLGVTLTLSRDKASLAHALQERLRRPVQLWSWLTDLDQTQRSRWHHLIRLYDTGAAMALLMDDLVSDWQSVVQNGVPLYDVLRHTLDTMPEAVDLDSLLNAHGYRRVPDRTMRTSPFIPRLGVASAQGRRRRQRCRREYVVHFPSARTLHHRCRNRVRECSTRMGA